jgi:hypothetical protein
MELPRMRIAIIVLGVILIGLGAAIWLGKIGLPSEHETVKVGGISATLTRDREIPPWLGIYTALTGLAIALLGTRYR